MDDKHPDKHDRSVDLRVSGSFEWTPIIECKVMAWTAALRVNCGGVGPPLWQGGVLILVLLLSTVHKNGVANKREINNTHTHTHNSCRPSEEAGQLVILKNRLQFGTEA